MDDGGGTANGTRFGITEAAHHGDEFTTSPTGLGPSSSWST